MSKSERFPTHIPSARHAILDAVRIDSKKNTFQVLGDEKEESRKNVYRFILMLNCGVFIGSALQVMNENYVWLMAENLELSNKVNYLHLINTLKDLGLPITLPAFIMLITVLFTSDLCISLIRKVDITEQS